ncbi:MAG: hypothetical protein Q9225_003984 [Loekoesia sp. 1 TL-2023]
MATQLPFETAFAEACSDGSLPGVILAAADKTTVLIASGETFTYFKAFGVRSSKAESSSKPLEPNTILAIASCTKLLTAIAVLQLVEKRLVSLDADVGETILELSKLEIITGINQGSGMPEFEPKMGAVTLRQLLSHSSGLGMDVANPLLAKWRESRGETTSPGVTIEERCNSPLLFEPGTSWAYGVGTSWAGKLVERITGVTLEIYFKDNVLDPLGLKDVTFWPEKRPDMQHRMADLSMTDPAGGVKAVPLEGIDLINGSVDCLGGSGLFASAQDFLIILHAVLTEDERLLRKESYQELLTPQLNDASEQALNDLLARDSRAYHFYGMNVPLPAHKSWSLSGIVTRDEQPGWMGRNTVLWGGIPNIIWFIDRENGLCGLVAPQIITLQDPSTRHLCGLFQRGVYDLYSKSC